MIGKRSVPVRWKPAIRVGPLLPLDARPDEGTDALGVIGHDLRACIILNGAISIRRAPKACNFTDVFEIEVASFVFRAWSCKRRIGAVALRFAFLPAQTTNEDSSMAWTADLE